MSHCTKFKFQYTSRKIICRTFQTLGLDWEDGQVAEFSSTFTKKLGIFGENETPAIIAERDGFQYFMMNMGGHYELLMEKHNMTSIEQRQSREMATEFQQTYIQEVAKDVVKQMNNNGETAILEQTTSGYEIRFGHTYDKSILIKFDSGRVIEEVHGVKGETCVSLTEALENMLSSPDIELQSEWTEEYYQDPDNGLKIYDLNIGE